MFLFLFFKLGVLSSYYVCNENEPNPALSFFAEGVGLGSFT